LEIYYLNKLPETLCNGNMSEKEAFYCQEERRIFAQKAIHDNVKVDIWLTQTVYHEIAHAFFNPINADKSRFIAEGLALAGGESNLRITNAAVNFAHLYREQSIEQLHIFADAINNPVKSSIEEYQQSSIESAEIAKQPLTDLQKKYLCLLLKKPLDTEFIISRLTITAGDFDEQKNDELYYANASAWALFHFSGESGDKTITEVSNNVHVIFLVLDDLFSEKNNISPEHYSSFKDYVDNTQKQLVDFSSTAKLECTS
jgi:hypothetical protein